MTDLTKNGTLCLICMGCDNFDKDKSTCEINPGMEQLAPPCPVYEPIEEG